MRKDFKIITSYIEENSKILDLGCGDGSLLEYIKGKKNAVVRGIEMNLTSVKDSMKKGLSVIQSDMDEGLDYFPDRFFDVVILSRTIQETYHPHHVIQEMLRVGHRGIIAFLNYGFISNRIKFLFRGRQPKSEALLDDWFDTPNIHPLSIRDFESYCNKNNLKIVKKTFLKGDWETKARFIPNLFAGYAIYMIEKR